jgi:hypothetical protein
MSFTKIALVKSAEKGEAANKETTALEQLSAGASVPLDRS